MEITGTLVIAADTAFLPVEELPEDVRNRVQAEEGDVAITRRNSRVSTRIVDADAARLLQEFREPTTVIQAVIRYCSETKANPEATLEASFPLLQGLVGARLLVAIDSPEAKVVRPILDAGSVFLDSEVLDCLQTLEDTDVYRVRTSEGNLAALKLMRSTDDFAIAMMFDREAVILRHLDAEVTPSLLRAGSEGGVRYLLLSWCEGSNCTTLAKGLRDVGDRLGLLRLGIAILNAYAQLHSRNVIHSDIHPGNVLVDEFYNVRLVDFGLARISDVTSTSREVERGGVGYYFEPEYASAVRSGRKPPLSSYDGEQYSLGALLYLLFTGKHYLDFSLDRNESERQITEDAPLAFSKQSAEPWPAIEKSVARALSKDPTARFASVAEFAAALVSISERTYSTSGHTYKPANYSTAKKTLQRFLKRLDSKAVLFRSDKMLAPRASVTFGSAGIAYALHRIACSREDAKVLSLADLWSERAGRESQLQDAWYNSEIEITPETVGTISPYHTEAGAHYAKAHVANAMNDFVTQQKSVDGFIAASIKPCENLDVSLGRSGTLLTASHLVAALNKDGVTTLEKLGVLGNNTMASLWRELDSYASIRECSAVPYRGAAHGWAGILYATLCWSQASSIDLPTKVEERLEQLASLANCSGQMAWWSPGGSTRIDARAPLAASWCNGTAGYVPLWLAAHAVFGEERYLSLAVQAGNHIADTDAGIGTLCCGLSGQAYALLSLYRQSGDTSWLHRAQVLAEKAARSFQNTSSSCRAAKTAERPESLYRGELGVAVLAADIENPSASSFPAFEKIDF